MTYGYGYKLNDVITICIGYDFDTAYDNYVELMEELRDDLNVIGKTLADCDWHGVFSVEELSEMIKG